MSNKSTGSNSKPQTANFQIQQVSYSGLIPHPDILAGFQKIDTELPMKVVEMARLSLDRAHEIQLARIEADKKDLEREAAIAEYIVKKTTSYDFRGQILVFLLVAMVLSFAILAAFNGYENLGIAIVSGGFVVIATSAIKGFIGGKKTPKPPPSH